MHQVEKDEEARRCSVCGGDSRECQDAANGRAYEVSIGRCFRTKAVDKQMSRRGDDDHAKSLVASTTFHPEWVKAPTQ